MVRLLWGSLGTDVWDTRGQSASGDGCCGLYLCRSGSGGLILVGGRCLPRLLCGWWDWVSGYRLRRKHLKIYCSDGRDGCGYVFARVLACVVGVDLVGGTRRVVGRRFQARICFPDNCVYELVEGAQCLREQEIDGRE